MGRDEIIEKAIQRNPLIAVASKAILQGAFDAFLAAIILLLKTTNEIQLRGFGTFTVIERAPRKARNPKTGETVMIPARKTIKFKPGKVLKAEIRSSQNTSEVQGG